LAHKKAIINGHTLFELTYIGDKHICTIENVGKDEYYVYIDKGEGYSIAELNTIDIIELMTTGEVVCNGTTIKPYIE